MILPSDPAELRLLAHAYADGELDAATALAVERRLNSDPAFASEMRRIQALKSVIGETLPRAAAPDALRARVKALAAPQPARPRFTRRDWSALAAGTLIGALLAGAGLHIAGGPAPADPLLTAVVANHRRALLAASPVDVASSDRHTVRPWFENRLALAAPAVDLADKGFPLVGGRVDIIDGEPAATLVFRAREHLISVTTSPARDATGGDAPQRFTLRGFSAWRWRDGARAFWAVSDVEAAEFDTFIKLFRAANAGA